MSDQHPHTVCIIGGGMSGLFTGALLAKNGYKVTVLEKNHIIGGGLQSFRRGDAVFNTGMQAFVGFEKGEIVREILNNYLNVSSLNILPMNISAQEIIWIDNNHHYCLPKGKVAFAEYLSREFPHEATGIHLLVDCIYKIGHANDYVWTHEMALHSEVVKYARFTAGQLIRRFVKDEKLVTLFGYIGIHVGCSLDFMSALEFGMMCNVYIEGSYRIVGENLMLAKALASYIEQHQGIVISGADVSHIECEGDIVKFVETRGGERVVSDDYVSAIPPSNLLNLSRTEIFRPATKVRVETYTNYFSGYAIYLDLKENSFPFINSAIFLPYRCATILPQYIYMLTPPHVNQNEWATTMEILIPACSEEFSNWKESYIEKRGKEYLCHKQSFAEKIICYVSEFYPQLKESINNIYTATGLTIRDYYNNPNGAVYGQQGLFIPVKTKMKNLFLTGQAIQYQGLCGTVVASVLTAETMLNKSIIKEITRPK